MKHEPDKTTSFHPSLETKVGLTVIICMVLVLTTCLAIRISSWQNQRQATPPQHLDFRQKNQEPRKLVISDEDLQNDAEIKPMTDELGSEYSEQVFSLHRLTNFQDISEVARNKEVGLADLARLRLGDSSRWIEIYQLNQWLIENSMDQPIDPQQLRMPSRKKKYSLLDCAIHNRKIQASARKGE